MGDNGNALAQGLLEQAPIFGQAALDGAGALLRAVPEHYFTYAAGGVLLCVLAAITLKIATRPRYATRRSLVTQAERTLLDTLDEAVAGQYRIALKPRVADILTLEGGSRRRRIEGMRSLFGMHFDYALCDPQTLNVLAVIELDDRSHRDKQVQRRDRLKDEACHKAELPLLRIKASSGYSTEIIKQQISDKMDQYSRM